MMPQAQREIQNIRQQVVTQKEMLRGRLAEFADLRSQRTVAESKLARLGGTSAVEGYDRGQMLYDVVLVAAYSAALLLDFFLLSDVADIISKGVPAGRFVYPGAIFLVELLVAYKLSESRSLRPESLAQRQGLRWQIAAVIMLFAAAVPAAAAVIANQITTNQQNPDTIDLFFIWCIAIGITALVFFVHAMVLFTGNVFEDRFKFLFGAWEIHGAAKHVNRLIDKCRRAGSMVFVENENFVAAWDEYHQRLQTTGGPAGTEPAIERGLDSASVAAFEHLLADVRRDSAANATPAAGGSPAPAPAAVDGNQPPPGADGSNDYAREAAEAVAREQDAALRPPRN